MKLRNLKNLILDTLFPQFCVACRKQGKIVCYDCLSLIDSSEYIFCPFCRSPKRAYEKGVCPKHQNLCLDGLFSAAAYNQPVIKKLIWSFKYPPYLKTLSPHLAYLIITHIIITRNKIIQQGGENSVFVPMPLHKTKQRYRGFNQTELISKELSFHFKIPVLANQLLKIKKTKNQIALTKEQRAENIKNAFIIKNPQAVAGKKVFLVDDIFTTGATMIEASRVLKKAGAKYVWGIVIAREP